MRIYVDMNTTNIYDAFSIGFEGMLERTLEYHRMLVSGHENERVRENADYFKSKAYEGHLSALLLKGFGHFHTLINSQLVCFNTEHSRVSQDDPVTRLMNTCTADVVGELVKFPDGTKLEYALFDEAVMDDLYVELEAFREELIRIVNAEINDALKVAILIVKNK